jgi:hypothetical protein
MSCRKGVEGGDNGSGFKGCDWKKYIDRKDEAGHIYLTL